MAKMWPRGRSFLSSFLTEAFPHIYRIAHVYRSTAPIRAAGGGNLAVDAAGDGGSRLASSVKGKVEECGTVSKECTGNSEKKLVADKPKVGACGDLLKLKLSAALKDTNRVPSNRRSSMSVTALMNDDRHPDVDHSSSSPTRRRHRDLSTSEREQSTTDTGNDDSCPPASSAVDSNRIIISSDILLGIRRLLLFAAVLWWSTLHFQVSQCLDGECGPLRDSIESILYVESMRQVLPRMAVLAGTMFGLCTTAQFLFKSVKFTLRKIKAAFVALWIRREKTANAAPKLPPDADASSAKLANPD